VPVILPSYSQPESEFQYVAPALVWEHPSFYSPKGGYVPVSRADKKMSVVSERRKLVVRPLTRRMLPRDTVTLARFLVGATLVHDLPGRRMAARIVETEAYVIGDPAGHAYRGKTPRNGSLFLERGRAYVYFVYGCWHMLNVSSEQEGIGAGVLIRALEPIEGFEHMVGGRNRSASHEIARGPGRAARAFRIDTRQDGMDLCGAGPLWLGTPIRKVGAIGVSTRIGLTNAADRLLRFYEKGNPSVSGPVRFRI
jgi:DNA-3-methyladenine glycosylase